MSNLDLFFKLLILFFGSYENTSAPRAIVGNSSSSSSLLSTSSRSLPTKNSTISTTIIPTRTTIISTILTATTITTIPPIKTTTPEIPTTKIPKITTAMTTTTRFSALTTLLIPPLTTEATTPTNTVTELMKPNKNASSTEQNSKPVTSKQIENFLTKLQVTQALKITRTKTYFSSASTTSTSKTIYESTSTTPSPSTSPTPSPSTSPTLSTSTSPTISPSRSPTKSPTSKKTPFTTKPETATTSLTTLATSSATEITTTTPSTSLTTSPSTSLTKFLSTSLKTSQLTSPTTSSLTSAITSPLLSPTTQETPFITKPETTTTLTISLTTSTTSATTSTTILLTPTAKQTKSAIVTTISATIPTKTVTILETVMTEPSKSATTTQKIAKKSDIKSTTLTITSITTTLGNTADTPKTILAIKPATTTITSVESTFLISTPTPVKTQTTTHFPTPTTPSLTTPISTPATRLASTTTSTSTYETTNTRTTSLLLDAKEEGLETKDFVVDKSLMVRKMREIKRNKFRNDVMVIEIFVVVDYSCYLKWLEFSSGKEERALYNLRFYISNLIKEIKDKFSSISVSSYRYGVKLIGYHIIKKSDGSSFLKSASLKRFLKPEKSLKTFSDWLQEGKRNFPQYDIAIGLTNHKLEKYHGMSYIGTACTKKGVALVSEEGLMATVDTAVHEMGHLLGSYHDGSNNECSSRNNYIMTPTHLTTNHKKFDTFSSCSLRYFRRYITLLDSNNRNCLRHHSGYDMLEQRLLNTSAGQYFKLKQQCQLVYGLKSFYCSTGADTHKNICKEIFCFNPNTSSCSRTPTLKALEGTTCGDKMWCFNELCASHPSAPATHRKDCLYGDLSELVENTAVNSVCSFLVNKRRNCYSQQVEKMCCETCSRFAKPSSPDCKYGDRLEDCTRMPKPENFCLFSKVKHGCCQYCRSFTKASTSIQHRNSLIIRSYQKEN